MQSLRASTSQLVACAACAFPSTSRRTFASSASRLVSIPRSARKTPPSKEVKTLSKPRPLAAGTPKTELFTGLTTTPAVRSRSSLVNEASAQAVVKAWGIDQMDGVTVVEAYAGALAVAVVPVGLPPPGRSRCCPRSQDREA